MDREQLKQLDLSGKRMHVILPDERRTYTLTSRVGSNDNMKAAMWKACDSYSRDYAIKLVPVTDYATHSIRGELYGGNQLGPRFARIEAYGSPEFEDQDLKELKDTAYAIVVEWVEGQTLAEYCMKQGSRIDVPDFLKLAESLCEVLALLSKAGLSHSDLHSENIMISAEPSGPKLEKEAIVRIVDTGSLMTMSRKDALLQGWRDELASLGRQANPDVEYVNTLRERARWFSRTDQEWVVSHLCALLNAMRREEFRKPGTQRKFLREVSPILGKMIDPDLSIRVDDPVNMYQAIEGLWKTLSTPLAGKMNSPFDLISAELIRSDKKLNELFSKECPWYESCDTSYPVYIYGPRGCGKSTILRMLSLPAALAGEDAREVFQARPFIGVYLSCSSELRSRFLLFPEEKYPDIAADAVLFFVMLLVEALLDTLEYLRDGVIESYLGRGTTVGLTNDTARDICGIVCSHFGLSHSDKLRGVSWLTYARKAVAIERSKVWQRILAGQPGGAPNPSLLFDLCEDLEAVFPLLAEKHIAFLLDDYSNQRIPDTLQRMLNKTISFAKQGNPIFKVSSEYQGVDLEGIQEGREVVEINIGKEYVDLTERRPSALLEDVLDIRFRVAEWNVRIADVLGKSGIKPAVPMARKIRTKGRRFYYHGIDTVGHICSGDLAMALDLVKQLFDRWNQRGGEAISPPLQHEVIRQYADREHTYLRYYSPHGKAMSEIADALCLLAHEAAMECESKKDGQIEPMVKTSLDIPLGVLDKIPPDSLKLLQEMEKKGVLFSLDTSRSRLTNQSTERFQVRRILLVKYIAPLGRRDAIKLDDEHKLNDLLTDPYEFIKREKTGQRVLFYENGGI